ncbi:hypothetical protein BDF19DRAFT_467907 [Syncephalis fuscata]|nr:hypothetical protein BDF19DRAFT_467907 [Syncephalis fuscata]
MECILNHIDAVSYEFPHIEIAADVLHSPILEEDRQVYQQKKQTFIHTILLTKNWNIKLERILKLSDQVIHLSSKHGNQKRPTIDYELLVQRGDGLVFNNAIDWSIVEKYDHVIGDLFFVCAKEDDGSLTYILLDMKASELLQEFHDRNDDNFKFSMNTSIIYRKDKSLITLMNHSAL